MSIGKKIFGTHLCALLFLTCAYTQKNDSIRRISDEHCLKEQMNKLVNKDYYIDTSSILKIVFELKVDSLGEIHSAHIRWSQNLKASGYYPICFEIESTFNVFFLYKKYKNEFLVGKYVFVRVPFFTSP